MTKVAKNSNRGSKPGERRGGRSAGTPNKKTKEQIETVKATGQTPLEFLTGVYQAEIPPELKERVEKDNLDANMIGALTGWYDRRIEAAKAAAPYCHSKLVAVHETQGKKKSFAEWAEEHGLAP